MINFTVKLLPQLNYEVGEYIQSRKLFTVKTKQEEDLKKVIVNMRQAEDYIKKQ